MSAGQNGSGGPKFPEAAGRRQRPPGARSDRILPVSPGVLGVPGRDSARAPACGAVLTGTGSAGQPAVAIGQLPWADTSTDTVELRVCYATSSTGSTCRRSLPQSAPARALHLQPRAFRRSERASSSAAAQLTDRHRSPPPPPSVGAPKQAAAESAALRTAGRGRSPLPQCQG
jgi:hypothetical protein